MRNIVFLIAILFTINSYSQKCKVSKSFDEFEDIQTFTTSKINLSKKGIGGFLNYKIHRIVKGEMDRTLITFYINDSLDQCLTKDSNVIFLFNDGEKLKLNTAYKNIDCGVYYITIDVTEYLEDLKNISKIRIDIEAPFDFEIKEKSLNKFNFNIDCIKSENN